MVFPAKRVVLGLINPNRTGVLLYKCRICNGSFMGRKISEDNYERVFVSGTDGLQGSCVGRTYIARTDM
jgi:hypothetical protein